MSDIDFAQVIMHGTCRLDMEALDHRRMQLERGGGSPQDWRKLAAAFEEQGRLAQAAAMMRRAEYYNQVEAYA